MLASALERERENGNMNEVGSINIKNIVSVSERMGRVSFSSTACVVMNRITPVTLPKTFLSCIFEVNPFYDDSILSTSFAEFVYKHTGLNDLLIPTSASSALL